MSQDSGGETLSTMETTRRGRPQASPLRLFVAELQRYPEIGALAGFLVVFIGFAIFAEHFVTPANLAGILAVAAQLGIVAVGATFLMISGEFDLSVGSVIGVAAMATVMMFNAGVPQLLAVLIALALSALIGLVNGMIVIWMRIPSFIATLGAMMLWRGLIFAVTGGFPVRYRGYSTLMYALNGPLNKQGFRASAFWLATIVVAFTIVLTQTRYGNAVYATGGNPGSARALGVNVRQVKVINFVISAVLAGFVGILIFCRFKSSAPTYGQGMELEAIAASVIGGAMLTGGYGSVVGTLLGSLMMGMVAQGLVLAGAPTYWYQAFIGVILVIAVIINTKVRGK